jgi:hypothetical protein
MQAFAIYGTTHEERQEVSGHDFSRADEAIRKTWALQGAEELDREVGRGFIPGNKPFEST